MQQYVTIHVTIHVTIPCNNWNLVGGVHVAFVYRKEKEFIVFSFLEAQRMRPPTKFQLLHGIVTWIVTWIVTYCCMMLHGS